MGPTGGKAGRHVRSERPGSVIDVSASQLAAWLETGEVVLVDVREPFEHGEERIGGAVNVPLGRVDAARVHEAGGGRRVVLHCKTGKRSAKAAGRLAESGEQACQLAGGMEAWIASGLPTIRSVGGTFGNSIGVMRQVQITAGSLVALGTGLGVVLSPWWLVVPGFVGCGLVFAGATGWCGMAMLLGRMPWNQRTPAACAA